MGQSISLTTPILGSAVVTAKQMQTYLLQLNPSAANYAELYIQIGSTYGVGGDLAFAQSIMETNAWRFGGVVKVEQNNFAGLGAISVSEQGASFSTPTQGIEAQIQHLYGYATSKPLPEQKVIIDPRFQILETAGMRGTAPNWEDLNGKWAVPGKNYGEDIVRIWNEIRRIPTPALTWKEAALQWLKDENLINADHDPDEPVTWAEFGTVLKRFKMD